MRILIQMETRPTETEVGRLVMPVYAYLVLDTLAPVGGKGRWSSSGSLSSTTFSGNYYVAEGGYSLIGNYNPRLIQATFYDHPSRPFMYLLDFQPNKLQESGVGKFIITPTNEIRFILTWRKIR
jgi:hypothetical protein